MMGMYDLLVCGFPLPGNPPKWVVGHEFQMKDGNQVFDRYIITPDGGLMIAGGSKPSPIDDSVTLTQPDERVWYHGDINFYTTGDDGEGHYYEGHQVWLEYRARFSHGLLDWIVLVEARDIPGMSHDQVQVVWRDRTLDEVGITDWRYYGITEEIAAAYLDSLNKHIAAVRKAGLKLGVPREQLDIHDQSKFSLEEFPHYARNFFGDKGDPDGWARAWLHHIHHNPHHWNHYVFADGFTPRGSTVEDGVVKMPHKFMLEMVADWMGAGYAYTGSWDMTKWLADNVLRLRLHSLTWLELGEVLAGLGYNLDELWRRGKGL